MVASPGASASGRQRPSRRRILLSAVAAALTLTALIAIAVLLFGRFGETEGRILGTTLLLAACGVLALPGAILLDQERLSLLVALLFGLALAVLGFAAAGIWIGELPVVLGKVSATLVALALATSQTSALAARRHEHDVLSVRRLFTASTLLVYALAAGGSAAVWAELDSQLFVRLFGAGVVLDVLLVTLQPVLALLRRPQRRYLLHVRVDDAGELDVTVEASSLSRAAARAIERAEADGRRVLALELVQPWVER
jgi:hypothetical protein